MEINEKLNKDNETLETNRQELSDEKLEQVTGGSKVGDPIFDEVTTILIKWRDTLWNFIPNDSVFANIDAAAEKEFNGGRYTAIESAINQLKYYDSFYRSKLSEDIYNDLLSELNECLVKSEN